jgi:serine/threonine protein kinase
LQLSDRATIAASGKKQFRTEVAALGSLSHVNLVQLRGFCVEGKHRLLVYECMENGSLDKWIFRNNPSAGPPESGGEGELLHSLPWEVRYRIAVDMARGLAFLHEGSREKVVHLDVKPQNVLLDASFRGKISDFGLCKLIDRGEGETTNQTMTAMRGTPGYMAPEWFLNLPITEKSDIFSYGMVLLELVGGRKNLNLAMGSEDGWYFPAWAVKQAESGDIVSVIDKQLLEEVKDNYAIATESMKRLIHVAFWCIQENASSRPAMSTILLMLEQHLEVPDPPLELTYVLRRQSRPDLSIINSHDTTTATSAATKSSNAASSMSTSSSSSCNQNSAVHSHLRLGDSISVLEPR